MFSFIFFSYFLRKKTKVRVVDEGKKGRMHGRLIEYKRGGGGEGRTTVKHTRACTMYVYIAEFP